MWYPSYAAHSGFVEWIGGQPLDQKLVTVLHEMFPQCKEEDNALVCQHGVVINTVGKAIHFVAQAMSGPVAWGQSILTAWGQELNQAMDKYAMDPDWEQNQLVGQYYYTSDQDSSDNEDLEDEQSKSSDYTSGDDNDVLGIWKYDQGLSRGYDGGDESYYGSRHFKQVAPFKYDRQQ